MQVIILSQPLFIYLLPIALEDSFKKFIIVELLEIFGDAFFIATSQAYFFQVGETLLYFGAFEMG